MRDDFESGPVLKIVPSEWNAWNEHLDYKS